MKKPYYNESEREIFKIGGSLHYAVYKVEIAFHSLTKPLFKDIEVILLKINNFL